MEKNIFVLGSISIDFVINMDHFPLIGETIIADKFMINQGGKGANQCAAISQIGKKPYLIGAIGGDYTDEILQSLRGFNIDLTYLKKLDAETGKAFIFVEHGDNRIVVAPGTNHMISANEVKKCLSSAREGDIFLTEMENTVAVVYESLKYAKERGLITVLNNAPGLPLNDYHHVDYLIINETEFAALSGIKTGDPDSLILGFHKLQKQGVSKLLLTLGREGSYYIDDDQIIPIASIKVDSIDSTSAGDAYVGAFVAGLADEMNLIENLNRASVCGGLTCTKKGASRSIPDLREIARYMENEKN